MYKQALLYTNHRIVQFEQQKNFQRDEKIAYTFEITHNDAVQLKICHKSDVIFKFSSPTIHNVMRSLTERGGSKDS